MNIADIDKNYAVVQADGYEMEFHDVMMERPELLEGLPFGKKEKRFCRLPQSMSEVAGKEILSLSRHTSGAAVRFVTSSPAITVRFVPDNILDIDNMPLTSRAGVDIYFRTPGCGEFRHCGTLRYNGTTSFEMKKTLLFENKDGVRYEYIINLPPYGGVACFFVGLVNGFELEAAPAHAVDKPVLFYGSSITQGAAASRPGLNYCTRLCRAVDAEQINLGFSGNAKGEEFMAHLIASLELSAFVYDYDHNAPTPEHLETTHWKFFEIIRSKAPDLPIIMMSRPYWGVGTTSLTAQRREIIRRSWQRAKDRGDENVYFIDGKTLFEGPDESDCTSDLVHPNDIGFERMYLKVLPVLRQALKLK